MNVLIVAPHPDDDVIGMGGTMHQHLQNGDRVDVLYLTSGDAGGDAETRESEARAAGRYLGMDDTPPATPFHFWNEPDGRLQARPDLIQSLVDMLQRLEIDLVYVTHEAESHNDHRAAARLVREALKQLPALRCWTYEVWTPQTRVDRLVDISDHIHQKVPAIFMHESQVKQVLFAEAATALNRFRGELHNRPHGPYAEAFARMKGTGMTRTTLLFLTFTPSLYHQRHAVARRCLAGLLAGVKDTDLQVHIADDGSPAEHVQRLVGDCHSYGIEPTVTVTDRRGYGGNYNAATQTVHAISDYVLAVEDDWELIRPLNLQPLIKAMEDSEGALQCVRLGYLGWTNPLRGELAHYNGMSFLAFDPASPELFVFTGHPRLESVAFERQLGAWSEGIPAGATEMELSNRPGSRLGVAWPLDMGINASQQHCSMFAHIGGDQVGEILT